MPLQCLKVAGKQFQHCAVDNKQQQGLLAMPPPMDPGLGGEVAKSDLH